MNNTARLVFAAFSALSLVACKSNLDNKKLEGAITDGLKAKDVTLKSVSCPSDRPVKTGDTFDCDAETSTGDKMKVHITQSDDQGNVAWKVDSLPTPKAADDSAK